LVLKVINFSCPGGIPLCINLFFKTALLKWNSHTIHPFKVCNWMAFSTFTDTCNHHHSQFPTIFIISKRNPVHCAITPYLPIPFQPQETINYFVSMDFPILDFHMNEIIFLCVTGFFHLACLQSSSMLYHVSVFHSFL